MTAPVSEETLVPSWGRIPVYATWVDTELDSLEPGTFEVHLPYRVRILPEKKIVRAGKHKSGALNSTGPYSLVAWVPSNDDPDVGGPADWKVTVKVRFAAGGEETYILDTPLSAAETGINLVDYEPQSSTIPQQQATYKIGVPGGLATLNADGKVVDADGNPVTGSGPSYDDSALAARVTATEADVDALQAGKVDSSDSRLSDARTPTAHQHPAADISDSTSVGRSVVTAANAAAARTAIGAGTSSLAVGTAATDAKAGNWKPAAADITDASTVTRSLITATSATAARAAIGAGTSDLQLGTGPTTAKAGDWKPAWADVTGKPSTFTPAAHTHTKADVGLGSVDNTSDAAKPVSTAQAAALAAKPNVRVESGGTYTAPTANPPTIFIGATTPTALAAGDVWMKTG